MSDQSPYMPPVDPTLPQPEENLPTPAPTSSLAFLIKKMGGAKVVSGVFGMLLLAGGLGAGLVLVSQPQLLGQKAASTSSSTIQGQLVAGISGRTAKTKTEITTYSLRTATQTLRLSGSLDKLKTIPVGAKLALKGKTEKGAFVVSTASDAIKITSTPQPKVFPPMPTAAPKKTKGKDGKSVSAQSLPAPVTKKVFVVNIDPYITGTTSTSTYYSANGWTPYATTQAQYINDINAASHGYVNYQIINPNPAPIRNYPVKDSGFVLTPTTWQTCYTSETKPDYCEKEIMNYEKFLKEYVPGYNTPSNNLCTLIDSGAADEIWIWSPPFMQTYEYRYVGLQDDPYRPIHLSVSGCNKRFPIMGFNFERGTAEALHSFGHRVEYNVTVAYNRSHNDPLDPNNPWSAFSAHESKDPGQSGCGNVHFPPNGTYNYDYGNQTNVQSTCADWPNYPNFTGDKKSVNCNTWASGCGDPSEYGWQKYWLSHLPYVTGSTNGILNNWWAYVVDWQNTGTPPVVTPPPTPIVTPPATAKFNPVSKWTSSFDLSHGWTVQDFVRTVGDVDGDGRSDVVGFGLDGVYVARSTGSGFSAISKWTSAFDLSHSWTVKDFVRTTGDVNGDGKSDLVGFGLDGVYIALSTGTTFSPVSQWTSAFDLSHGWTVKDFVRTVGDVNGDGKSDLVGFGLDGVYVALSNGTTFAPVVKWTSAFDLGHGWTIPGSIRTAGDVNGDGKADIVGFNSDGVYVALSTGSVFSAITKWSSDYSGWTINQYVRTLGDINNDSKADVVGFGLDGVYVALSTGSGFSPSSIWTTDMVASHGWTVQDFVRTTGDVNDDGKADLVGFGQDGVYVTVAK